MRVSPWLWFSIFSTPDDPVGIQVGTAIATLVSRAEHGPAQRVAFRHLWGQSKHGDVAESAESEPDDLYGGVTPLLSLGLPFAELAVSDSWQDWPSLPDLFPTSFPGVKTSRDGFLVDVNLDRLKQRVADYFDANLSHEEIARRYRGVMRSTGGSMPVLCLTRCSNAADRPTTVSYATLTAHSTPAGSSRVPTLS